MSTLAAKARARILKPGELTLAIYGADEAVKWEQRVMTFTRKCRSALLAGNKVSSLQMDPKIACNLSAQPGQASGMQAICTCSRADSFYR